MPVQANEGDINFKQMEVIAGGPQNVLLDAVENGFEALNEDLSNKITGLVCSQPCYNPFHNHPPHALSGNVEGYEHDHDHDDDDDH